MAETNPIYLKSDFAVEIASIKERLTEAKSSLQVKARIYDNAKNDFEKAETVVAIMERKLKIYEAHHLALEE